MLLKGNLIPLALLTISFCIEFMEGSIGLLRYDRDAVLEGELWRLITAHLVHGSRLHWLFNTAGLLLVWAIYPSYFRQSVAILLTASIALLISMALLVLNPDVSWYLGMSALLHGLFATWSLVDLLSGRRIALIPLSFVVLKVLYEQYKGASAEVVATIGLPVLVDAHLYGVIAGLALGWGMCALGWLVVACGAKKRRSP